MIKNYLNEYQKEYERTAKELKYSVLFDTSRGVVLGYKDIDFSEMENIERFCEIYKLQFCIINTHNYINVEIF